MSGAVEVTVAPTVPPPPTTFCDGVVTTAAEPGAVFRFAAPLKVVPDEVVPTLEELMVVPLALPPLIVALPVVVPPGVVVTVPVGETDIVPEPFSVAVGAVVVAPARVPVAVVLEVVEGDVVTVLGVTVPFGEVVPMAVDVVVVPAPLVVPAPVPLVVPPPVPEVVWAIDAPAVNASAMAEMRMRDFMDGLLSVQTGNCRKMHAPRWPAKSGVNGAARRRRG
jgi:hypothetical protein